MLITTITTIGFKLPEEYEQMQNFILNNDMREWRKDEDTNYVCFTKTTYNTITNAEGLHGEKEKADSI